MSGQDRPIERLEHYLAYLRAEHRLNVRSSLEVDTETGDPFYGVEFVNPAGDITARRWHCPGRHRQDAIDSAALCALEWIRQLTRSPRP